MVLGCKGECPGSTVRAPSGCLLDDRAGWPGVAVDYGSPWAPGKECYPLATSLWGVSVGLA